MSYYTVYRINASGQYEKLQDFDFERDAQAFAQAARSEVRIVSKVIEDRDEWNDLHPSRPME